MVAMLLVVGFVKAPNGKVDLRKLIFSESEFESPHFKKISDSASVANFDDEIDVNRCVYFSILKYTSLYGATG